MKATEVYSGIARIVVLAMLMVGVALGQNITNTGTWTNTGTMTVTNFTNSGVAATFANSGGTSSLRVRNALNTTTAGALATNFNVSVGEVRYMGNGVQSINNQVLNSTYNNLSTTGAASSTKTLAGNIIVAGTLTSDGTGVIVSTGANTLEVTAAGTPIVSAGGGAFTFTGGTVNYGGAAQNIYATDYGTLGIIAAGGNKTMLGSFAVNTALNLTTGNMQIAANTLTVAGIIVTSSGTLEGGGSSNLTFSGSGNATLPSVANGVGTLVVNRTGGTDVVSLDGDLTVATALTLTDGDLNVGSTGTLTLNNTVSAGTGTLSSATDGTVNYNQGTDGQSVLATNYGNLTLSNFNKTLPGSTVGIAGIFIAGTATGHTVASNTISFNGGAQNIPSFNGATGYNDLSTAGGTKTVTGATIVVGGNFTNGSDVTTNVGLNTLAITGTPSQGNLAATMQFGGASNGLLFSTGTVEYNGAAQNIAGHASDTYANLLLSNTGTKTVVTGAANTVHTTSTLTVSSGITLDVQSGAFLTVDVDLNNNGSVTNAGTITVGS